MTEFLLGVLGGSMIEFILGVLGAEFRLGVRGGCVKGDVWGPKA